MSELQDAAENVLIHYSMGWELDEMMTRLQKALEQDRRSNTNEANKTEARFKVLLRQLLAHNAGLTQEHAFELMDAVIQEDLANAEAIKEAEE